MYGKLIKNIGLIVAIGAVSVFSGCSEEESSSSDYYTSSKGTFASSLQNNETSFIIESKIKKLNDGIKVIQKIEDYRGNVILSEESSSTGSITTTCEQNLLSGTYIEYICNIQIVDSSKDITTAKEKTILLYDNEIYNAYFIEIPIVGGTSSSTNHGVIMEEK